MTLTNPVQDFEGRVRNHRQWYHTLELTSDLVTPGWFDTRKVVSRLPMPASLEGKRCLDIGTFDGFWAFEMERRGAQEVLAIDVLDKHRWDWPVNSRVNVIDTFAERMDEGTGFELAREAFGSQVVRRELSVYELDPDLVGQFDFVYFGSVLLHLQNPVRALERVRSVCRGSMLSVDAIDLNLSIVHRRRPVAELDAHGRPWWWKPNTAAHMRMVEAAGFETITGPKRFLMPPGRGQPRERLLWARLRHKHGRDAVLGSWVGDPHSAILARPGTS